MYARSGRVEICVDGCANASKGHISVHVASQQETRTGTRSMPQMARNAVLHTCRQPCESREGAAWPATTCIAYAPLPFSEPDGLTYSERPWFFCEGGEQASMKVAFHLKKYEVVH